MRSERWTIKSALTGEVIASFIVEAHPYPVALANRRILTSKQRKEAKRIAAKRKR